VNEITEIIGQAGKQADFGSHEISVSSIAAVTLCSAKPYIGMKYGVNAERAMRYSARPLERIWRFGASDRARLVP
jgi:hypothetical protein